MIRRLTGVLLGVILGGGIVFCAFQFHLVRTVDTWLFVPKPQASLGDAYVDIRNWTAVDWTEHPAFARALMEHGRGDLVQRSVSQGLFQDLFRQFDGAARNDSSTERR